jgi:hypothetical protein
MLEAVAAASIFLERVGRLVLAVAARDLQRREREPAEQ